MYPSKLCLTLPERCLTSDDLNLHIFLCIFISSQIALFSKHFVIVFKMNKTTIFFKLPPFYPRYFGHADYDFDIK